MQLSKCKIEHKTVKEDLIKQNSLLRFQNEETTVGLKKATDAMDLLKLELAEKDILISKIAIRLSIDKVAEKKERRRDSYLSPLNFGKLALLKQNESKQFLSLNKHTSSQKKSVQTAWSESRIDKGSIVLD